MSLSMGCSKVNMCLNVGLRLQQRVCEEVMSEDLRPYIQASFKKEMSEEEKETCSVCLKSRNFFFDSLLIL